MSSTITAKLAQQILDAAKKPLPNAPALRLMWGIVTAITAGPTPTLSVEMAGNSVASTGVTFLNSYYPIVGDYVYCAWYGSDLVVLGKIVAVESIGQPASHTWSILGPLNATIGPSTTPPPMKWRIKTGQAVLLTGWSGEILSGGDITVDFQDEGFGIPSMTGLTISTTPTDVDLSTPYIVTNLHRIGPILDSVAVDSIGAALTLHWQTFA